jgi:ribose transport system substrate-binding protein
VTATADGSTTEALDGDSADGPSVRVRARPVMTLRSAALSLVLILAAVACAAPAPPRPTPSVALVVANVNLNYSQEMGAGFAAATAQAGGVETRIVGPEIVDGPREVQQFGELVDRRTDGISLFTLQPDLFDEPLSRAAAAGIPVIAVDNPLPVGSAAVSMFVGNDNVELGRQLADLVIDRLPAGARGTVVVATSSPGAPVLDQRADGIRQQFAVRRPGVRVLGPFDSKQEVSANLAAWRTLVAARPDALAFLGTGDADGWNLAAIRTESRGRWLAGAFDLDPRALAAVRARDLVLVSPEHFLEGALAGHLQARRAKGDGDLPTGWVYVPGLAVTPENVDAVVARQASAESRRAALMPEVDRILADLPAHLRPLEDVG